MTSDCAALTQYALLGRSLPAVAQFYAPLVISMLWITPLSRGLYVGYFGWITDETFNRVRLMIVVISGLLRMALLPHSIQEQ